MRVEVTDKLEHMSSLFCQNEKTPADGLVKEIIGIYNEVNNLIDQEPDPAEKIIDPTVLGPLCGKARDAANSSFTSPAYRATLTKMSLWCQDKFPW